MKKFVLLTFVFAASAFATVQVRAACGAKSDGNVCHRQRESAEI